MQLAGPIRKMAASFDNPVSYTLPVGDESLPLDTCIGRTLRLRFKGTITCIHCGRNTNKSFNQGYCYPCFTRLAECDMCIVKPELCHYDQGTCREPNWGQANCMKEHSVYLANTSGIKVGISQADYPITRWIDQGASQGLVIRAVPSRLDAGLTEVALKKYVSDKTDWRKMLRGEPPAVELERERDRILELHEKEPSANSLPGRAVGDARPVTITYPVSEYSANVRAFNLDKEPLVEGTLKGIKGQYLILDTGVLNIRKYAGYRLLIEVHAPN